VRVPLEIPDVLLAAEADQRKCALLEGDCVGLDTRVSVRLGGSLPPCDEHPNRLLGLGKACLVLIALVVLTKIVRAEVFAEVFGRIWEMEVSAETRAVSMAQSIVSDQRRKIVPTGIVTFGFGLRKIDALLRLPRYDDLQTGFFEQIGATITGAVPNLPALPYPRARWFMTKIFDLDVRMVDARLIVTKYIRNWRDIWTLGHFQLFLRNYETTIDENGLNDDKCSGYGTEDHQSSIDGKLRFHCRRARK